MTSSMTSGPTIDSSASITAAVHGLIFSISRAGQVAEVLAADGVERAEHHDALVGALLEHGLEAGGEGEHALAGAGVAAERHDADLGVGQQVDGDALLGRAAAHAEQLAVGAHQVQRLVGVDPGRAPTASRRGARRRCGTAGRAASVDRRRRRGRRARRSSAPSTSSSTQPVQLVSRASSLRYSSASQARRSRPSGAAAGPW